MQCSLSAHKLYKIQGGKDAFLYFLLNTITQLLSNSPRLERPLHGQQIDNIARLTGRNHWPARREAPDGRQASSKVKKCRVCYAKGRRTQKGIPIKTVWICKGCPEEPGLCVEKECFEDYHTKFDFSM